MHASMHPLESTYRAHTQTWKHHRTQLSELPKVAIDYRFTVRQCIRFDTDRLENVQGIMYYKVINILYIEGMKDNKNLKQPQSSPLKSSVNHQTMIFNVETK